ncbi:hypothetical protein [Pseudonocardia parietis]|uniref:Uncharacterized protein n=1 Tax=Pseudonocardia parietis TaxID=570936 RepID=A0ABS4VLJ2_9PSEU|nr:hypothetical protein [Pseudonocardia parietis]MBP2364783.1 hypothetical protein [Pseudonocardia parietis]
MEGPQVVGEDEEIAPPGIGPEELGDSGAGAQSVFEKINLFG